MKLWAKREEEDVGREVVNSLSSAVVPGLAPSAIIPSSSTAAAGEMVSLNFAARQMFRMKASPKTRSDVGRKEGRMLKVSWIGPR